MKDANEVFFASKLGIFATVSEMNQKKLNYIAVWCKSPLARTYLHIFGDGSWLKDAE